VDLPDGAQKVLEIGKGLAHTHKGNLEPIVKDAPGPLIVQDRRNLEEDFLFR
jgi:hypothetical protein